ncbi:MAG: KamA family radical SAM protein [Bacteroidales bacterium]
MISNLNGDVPRLKGKLANDVLLMERRQLKNEFTVLGQIDTISPRCQNFLHKFFPNISYREWNDWKWQLRNCFKSVEDLSRVMILSDDEKLAISKLKEANRLPMKVSPYYLSLIYDSKPGDPIRKTMIPMMNQLVTSPNEEADPLDETGTSPVKGIVHRYPDRVLFVVTQFCSAYCRYCTRSHLVGKPHPLTRDEWDNAIAYIDKHEEIRDVVVSGGDPLTMENSKLEYLLSRLRSIKHVEIIRLGTKVPAVLPMRINARLLTMLKKYQPLYFSVHFTHPREMTLETNRACNMIADAGFPLGSQTVLLKGINDNPEVMKDLMLKLLKVRVRPYYIYQCDPIPGSSAFRTTVESGVNIIEHLRGHVSGYAVPHFVIDAPGGGGKVPILPNYVVKSGKKEWLIRNYEHNVYKYPNEK